MNGTSMGWLTSPAPAAGELVGIGGEVLLLLEERSEERQGAIELDVREAAAMKSGDPIDQLARARTLAEPLHLPDLVEDLHRVCDQLLLEVWMMHVDDASHQCFVREVDEVKHAAAEEGVGE